MDLFLQIVLILLGVDPGPMAELAPTTDDGGDTVRKSPIG